MPESKKYYENRSLFSDYYLENRMADHPRWEEDLSDIFQEMQAIYQEHRDHLDGLNEAQTEEEFIRPVLNILGFTWDVQTDVERQGRHNYPDYSLFQDEAAKKEALRHRDDPGMYYSHAIALADAKYWGRPLDQKLSDPREEYTNRNPSFQIIHYLVATGLEWGIVTNGAVWRLYSTKARSRVDTYYEMNLQKMLENAGADSPSRAVSAENLRAFKYFYHFFRAAAFIRDPETKKSFLEQVFDGSVNYGSQLQTRLKNLIFDQIFVHLAEGFIQHQRQNDHPEIESQENLDAIYEGTLRLLYRLLFILYAEARDLLPVKDEHGYRNYSLLSLKQRAAKAVDRGDTLVSIGHDYWNDLRDLFRFIDQGEPDLNIPRYNGGLFRSDHPKNDFFEQNMVPDKYLVPALDLLTRDVEPDTGQKRFIDYKTLDVEQLGSIYEGLLEFHLRIAEKELAVVKEKGAEAYKSLSEVKNPIRTVQPGEPYLENDKGQRKATGSYYTPDYIVQYIVENTVGSVLKERADQFGKLMDEIQERQRGRRKQSVRQLERQASESLLGIKICDPAMGSGHFLVRATDYLTEQIILELNKYPDNPIIHRIETIRNDVVETLNEQGIAIDRDALKDTNLLKRMVMKQCIYGVDLNPMAVELAKLSLWLDSFTIGAPLSFLDHHLKVGNSLIGTSVHEVESALQAEEGYTEDLFGSPFRGLLQAANLMRDVSVLTDATFSEVEQSISKYDAFETAIRPYKTILDVWVSQHFGNEGVKQVMEVHGIKVLDALKHNNRENLHESEKRALQTTVDLSTAHLFFHWELEFPEVFIDLEYSDWKENPGFDVVMGNPPYVRQEQLKENKHFFEEVFSVYNSTSDLYVYFYEIGHRILYEGGYFGMITSNKFMRAAYGKNLRKFLTENIYVQEIIDFGDLPVFPEVSAYPCILITARIERDSKSTRYFKVPSLDFDELTKVVASESTVLPGEAFTVTGNQWKLMSKLEYEILRKIEQESIPLKNWLGSIKINYGIKTGYNKAFFIDEETRKHLIAEDSGSVDLIKPLVVGDDIKRYEIEFKNRYLIWTYIGVPINNYPAIFNHLKQYQSDLEKRWDKGDHWWELRHCDYYDEFKKSKIIYPVIAKENKFSFDTKGYFSNDKTFIIPIPDKFCLALLNSKLGSFWAKNELSFLRGGYLEYRAQSIENFPIRKIDNIASPGKRNQILDETKKYLRSEDNYDFIGLRKYIKQREEINRDQAVFMSELIELFADQIISLHEQKQQEIDGLLSWLERFMGTSLDSLTGYTIIQDYYDIPGGKEELLERLAKNNSKIPNQDMTARAPQEKVLEEYEKSMSTLRPLLDRIAKTDHLIDQIVYQLYGLTEEEIRVVEGESV